MKKTTKTLLALLLIPFVFYAQSSVISKRISINNSSESNLLKIKDSGIDLSCGAIYKNNNLILELNEDELDALELKNISYTILIDDLIAYYKDRNERELPKAKQELELLKSQSNSNQRLSSTSNEIVDNFIQYEGCDEIDWAVPSNFQLGSLGGGLTVSEMEAQLDLMRSLYPNLISVKTDASPTGQVTHGNSFTNGGQYDTWSGETIYYVRISDNPDTDEPNEPESLFTGMTHAREVSSLMNLMYYMWYVLENYDTDPGIKNLVDNHEMYFIPVANPDGLRWNEQIAPSGGGLQRKNLNPAANTGNNNSRGVDLNRNYDYFWGSNPIYGGSSGTPSNQTYRGTSPFSEPETQIVRDFAATKNFKTAVNHHATSNLIPHAYNGYPGAPSSGREDDYSKFCHDLTRYNRYIYGEAPDILTIANGDMSDWMLGGVADVNGSTGSGQGILALAPENGAPDGSEGGFSPSPTQIVAIAKRAVRMNFVNAYYSGKFAQFHDFNTSDITSTSGNLDFGIEYLGQTLGDITLNVTPLSSNITSITPPITQTGWNKLEQRTVSASYTLDSAIQANDQIEFQITLSNDDGYILYQANIVKSYNPSVLLSYSDFDSLNTNWTASGGSWGLTSDAYSGSSAISDSPLGSYSNNQSKRLTLNTPVDLSSSNKTLIQFYAKWDLERNFDYVQLQGSTNGTNWVTLCGKYTKPGASILTTSYNSSSSSNTSQGKSTADRNNQPTGAALYEGNTMNKWVLEEVIIDDSNNSFLFEQNNVQFRFLFDSESNNRADGYSTTFDGFTFDEFRIIDIATPCVTSVPENVIASNITTQSAKIDWSLVTSANYDLRYREVGTTPWTNITNLTTNTYTISSLNSSSNYETQVRTVCPSGNSDYTASTEFTTQDNITCTGTSINTFPYAENFNAGIGDWTQATGDDGNWTLDANGTPSNNTGPSNDFNGGGNYFFTEASTSGLGFNATVNLSSPCFDLTGHENASFSFYYHMFGGSMGDLNTDITTDDGNTWTTLNTISGQQQTSNGAPWLQQVIDLSAYDNQVIKLRFSGTTGSSWQSDIAIDEINLSATFAPNAPIASCQDITVQLDANGDATIIANDINDGTSFGDLSIDVSTFDCLNIGTPVTVTLTATLASVSETCTATVTIQDNIDPIPDLTSLGDINSNNQIDLLIAPTATDNCDGTITGTNTIVFPITTTTTVVWIYEDTNGNSATQNQEVIILDTTNPTAPTNLTASNTMQTTTDLTWTAATDDVGVFNYDVIQDGNVIATVLSTNYQVTSLTANTTYAFSIIARDAAGNVSTNSNTINVTTLEVGNGCNGGITAYPYNESFESGLSNWTQSNNGDDDIDWTINSNGTPSGSTGPTNAVDGSFYIYVEASGNGTGFPNKRAILNSPCFDLSDSILADFSFKYHMFGSDDFGTINLEVSDDDGVTWTSIWNTFANQGNQWINQNIDLSGYIGGSIQLRFNRVTGGTWQADFALDDVNLIDDVTPSCSGGITSFPYNESFESNLGLWTQSNGDNIDWTRDNNGTPSDGTGPSNATDGSFYMYVEASGNGTGFPDKQALLNSPCFDLTNESTATFNFDYHMFGAPDFGTIDLQVSTNNGISWITIWTLSGNQGNSWLSQSIDLNAYLGNSLQLRFNRITGSTWQADFAFDNINLTTSPVARAIAETNQDSLSGKINSLKLYPNPVSNGVLNVSTLSSNLEYVIYNIYGQKISNGTLKNKSINVNNLETAVYIIEFSNEKETITKLFIKK